MTTNHGFRVRFLGRAPRHQPLWWKGNHSRLRSVRSGFESRKRRWVDRAASARPHMLHRPGLQRPQGGRRLLQSRPIRFESERCNHDSIQMYRRVFTTGCSLAWPKRVTGGHEIAGSNPAAPTGWRVRASPTQNDQPPWLRTRSQREAEPTRRRACLESSASLDEGLVVRFHPPPPSRPGVSPAPVRGRLRRPDPLEGERARGPACLESSGHNRARGSTPPPSARLEAALGMVPRPGCYPGVPQGTEFDSPGFRWTIAGSTAGHHHAIVEKLGRLTRPRTWGSTKERGGSNPPDGTTRDLRRALRDCGGIGHTQRFQTPGPTGHPGSTPGSRTARVVEWMVDTAASKAAAPAWA